LKYGLQPVVVVVVVVVVVINGWRYEKLPFAGDFLSIPMYIVTGQKDAHRKPPRVLGAALDG
jgi:hypothetical protein